MLNIPEKIRDPLNRQSILTLNQIRVQSPLSSQRIQDINTSGSVKNMKTQNASILSDISVHPVPSLKHTVQKGQKIPLNVPENFPQIQVCLGWEVKNPACDVDVSAFLLDSSGKVPDDDWFVFYGQKQSPDCSTVLSITPGPDRETVSIDFSRLHPCVNKIVFVLTINEAEKNNLNFSMIDNAYIRILNSSTKEELVSFCMDEYYANVTSMMIGEIYRYHDTWKFNAIGNGVARDLAGLCELYGVQVENSR